MTKALPFEGEGWEGVSGTGDLLQTPNPLTLPSPRRGEGEERG